MDLLILDVQVKYENPDLKKNMKIYSNISIDSLLLFLSPHIYNCVLKLILRILIRSKLKFYINCTYSILQFKLRSFKSLSLNDFYKSSKYENTIKSNYLKLYGLCNHNGLGKLRYPVLSLQVVHTRFIKHLI